MSAPAHISRENGKKGGRPKAAHTIASETARATLVRLAEAKINPIAEALIEKASRGDIPAIKELFDRVWGRAPQSVELTGKDGSQLIPKSDIDVQKIATEVALQLKSKKT